jgi:hypothetical protein
LTTAQRSTPSKLINKLRTLGPYTSLCNWILDFLMGYPQVVMVGNNTSTTLILNTGAPQRWVLSPLLYFLFTHDCTVRHDSNTIIMFADDTTVVSLITENDVDHRKKRTEHAPILIDGTVVEQVESFKFLGVHITNKLTWSKLNKKVVKRA